MAILVYEIDNKKCPSCGDYLSKRSGKDWDWVTEPFGTDGKYPRNKLAIAIADFQERRYCKDCIQNGRLEIQTSTVDEVEAELDARR